MTLRFSRSPAPWLSRAYTIIQAEPSPGTRRRAALSMDWWWATPRRRRPGRAAMLGKDLIRRLRDHVVAHLDEPIEVQALADIAGRSPFHFTRVFTRSVGMTPHRYVVHLRLQRAIELVREGQSGLAEIAVRTGFADQSHLSRWVRRVHGVPPTQLVA